jgi:LysR family glycine cleavage system transcriptional activator
MPRVKTKVDGYSDIATIRVYQNWVKRFILVFGKKFFIRTMHISQLPLTALRAFEMAARHLSFKAAATELHVTPTAISHQVQQLETLIGVKLFERVHRGLVLTEAGKACLRPLREGFESLAQAMDVLADFREAGGLSLSAPPSFTLRLLMPIIHQFLALHPEVDLNLTTRMREPGLATRSAREEASTLHDWMDGADVVIVYGGRPPLQGDIEVREVMPLSLGLLCSPILLETGAPLRCVDDVFHYPWLHDQRGLKYGRMSFWEQWLRGSNAAMPGAEQGSKFTHAALAIEAAVRGEGLLVTTPELCRAELTHGTLIEPFSKRLPLDASYYLIARRAGAPRIRAFIEWLCTELGGT